jgi:hypothetical protein
VLSMYIKSPLQGKALGARRRWANDETVESKETIPTSGSLNRRRESVADRRTTDVVVHFEGK